MLDQAKREGRFLISTLESAIGAAEAHSSFVHASGWLRRVTERLRQRWPDADSTFDPSLGYTVRV